MQSILSSKHPLFLFIEQFQHSLSKSVTYNRNDRFGKQHLPVWVILPKSIIILSFYIISIFTGLIIILKSIELFNNMTEISSKNRFSADSAKECPFVNHWYHAVIVSELNHNIKQLSVFFIHWWRRQITSPFEGQCSSRKICLVW